MQALISYLKGTILRMGKGGIKENDGGGEFTYDVL
jgi:hypothetical protein